MKRRTLLGSSITAATALLAGCSDFLSDSEYEAPGFNEGGLEAGVVADNQKEMTNSATIQYLFDRTINENNTVQDRTRYVDGSIPTYLVESEDSERYFVDAVEYENKQVETSQGEQNEYTETEKEWDADTAYKFTVLLGMLQGADWEGPETGFREGEETLTYTVSSMDQLSADNIIFVDPDALETSHLVDIELVANRATGRVYEIMADVDVELTTGSRIQYTIELVYTNINDTTVEKPEWMSQFE